MLIKKFRLLYISSKLFLLGKGIRRLEAKLSRTALKELCTRKTVQLARKAEHLKSEFAQTEEEFFRLLFSIAQNPKQRVS